MNPTFDEPNLRWTQPSMNPTFDEPNLWWTQPSMNQTFDDSNLQWTKPSMNPCGPLINFWIQMFLFYIILRVVFVILCLPFTIYTSESNVFVSGKNCLLFGGPQWCPPVFATICADDRFAQVLLLTPVQKELKFWKTDNLYCPCFVVKERMMMQSNWNSVETFFPATLSNYWNFSPSLEILRQFLKTDVLSYTGWLDPNLILSFLIFYKHIFKVLKYLKSLH